MFFTINLPHLPPVVSKSFDEASADELDGLVSLIKHAANGDLTHLKLVNQHNQTVFIGKDLLANATFVFSENVGA